MRDPAAADRTYAGVEEYAAAHSTPPSDTLVRVARATRAWSATPALMIDAHEARLLAILVSLVGARHVLEVGTFTGYSAIAMAEALPPGGRITTLEADPEHAAKAREHIDAAGLGDRVTVLLGPALESLRSIAGPFDLAFIDADKPAYPDYYAAILPRMRAGGLVVADNVLRGGRVLDGEAREPGVAAMRLFNETAVADPRVEVVMLAIRDGVSIMRVRG